MREKDDLRSLPPVVALAALLAEDEDWDWAAAAAVAAAAVVGVTDRAPAVLPSLVVGLEAEEEEGPAWRSFQGVGFNMARLRQRAEAKAFSARRASTWTDSNSDSAERSDLDVGN